ncbi:hypothetical protein C0416_02810 [bacterium]|nr:hypothetical protein [bacterium]
MIIPAIGLFILGTIFGSFLSVVNYRVKKKKKGIFFGRSQCTSCHKKLKIRQLIPIFSYLIGKGRCMSCGKKISMHYPLLELVSGLILSAIFIHAPFINLTAEGINYFDPFLLINFIYTGIIGLCFIGILFYDIQNMEIPEIYTIPAIILIFIWGIFSPSISFYEMAIGGGIAAIFFGLQVMISKEQWLGAGDTQVGIMMGLFFGWKLFLVALVLTYFVGLIVTLILMLAKKVKGTSKIPFAPFLVIGTFITLFFGNDLLNMYISTLL